MGGMWAFRVEDNRLFSRVIRSKILNSTLITKYSSDRDQQFLLNHVWPYAQSNAMTHDSYWCFKIGWNRYHRPFPTQRQMYNVTNYCHIGCPKPCCTNSYIDIRPCPHACRPKEHQNWTYC